MTDVEAIILKRLETIESRLDELTAFKSKIVGIVIAISGFGSIIGSGLISVLKKAFA